MSNGNGAERVYSRRECVVFRRTNEKFGGLSNMAPGYPLQVNGIPIRTSEALYQASRFPHNPEVQRLIIQQTSPMTAKMRSKPHRKNTRSDWELVRLNIMRWCLRVKLAQNWSDFGHLLLSTGDRPIVEESKKDAFWGAKPKGDLLIGKNALGRLLMELREELRAKGDALRQVAPLEIPDFLLYGKAICAISGAFDRAEPPSDARRRHLFVSYATEDAVFVEWLCLKLVSEGYYVWCDRLKLLGGESYPKDIDKAISQDSFRFIAVLSRHSIQKPNPLKERTLALNIAKQRNENFVIPINLDGLAATELGWMQADLTFILFQSWSQGLSQLFRLLLRSNAPRSRDRRSLVAQSLNTQNAVAEEKETLWSNLVEFVHIPRTLLRYEHDERMDRSVSRQSLALWPHYRENSTVCWSFEPPTADLITRYRFQLRGVCEDWREAEGPEINFWNLGKKVLNSALRHKLLCSGLVEDYETGDVYVPKDLTPERFQYLTPSGKSWVRTSGLRSFRAKEDRLYIRYHLSPALRTLLNFFGTDCVQIKIRLYLTDLSGRRLQPSAILAKRKAICRSWWNQQWLARLFATLHLLNPASSEIRIGSTETGTVRLSRWPIAYLATRRLDEAKLIPAADAAEEAVYLSEHRAEFVEETLEEEKLQINE